MFLKVKINMGPKMISQPKIYKCNAGDTFGDVFERVAVDMDVGDNKGASPQNFNVIRINGHDGTMGGGSVVIYCTKFVHFVIVCQIIVYFFIILEHFTLACFNI